MLNFNNNIKYPVFKGDSSFGDITSAPVVNHYTATTQDNFQKETSVKDNNTNKTATNTKDKPIKKHKKETKEIKELKEKEQKVRKTGLWIAGATIFTGAGIMFFLKGKKGKFLEKFKEKINNIKLKKAMSDVADNTSSRSYKLYKSAETGVKKAMGIFDIMNNFNSFKDIILKKLMYSSFGLKKIFPKLEIGKNFSDKMTNMYVIISKRAVTKEYERSKAVMLHNLPQDSPIKQIADKIYENLPVRLNKIDETATAVYEDMSQKVGKILTSSNFVADKKIKAKITTDIVEDNSIDFLRHQLSYSRNDKIKDATKTLMEIVNEVSFKDKESLSLLRKIKNNLKNIGTEKQADLEEDIAKLAEKFKNSTDERSIKVSNKVVDLKKVVEDKYQGAVEKYIQEMKNNPEVYSKETIKATEEKLEKWIKSLDDAIKLESRDYVERIRDLAMGTAFTDILGILAPILTLTYFITKAEDPSDRESYTIRYGAPALVSLGISGYCGAKLISGTKSILIAIASFFLLGKMGAALDNKIKHNQTKKQEIAKA